MSLLALLSFLGASGCSWLDRSPRAERGALDLTAWDFSGHGDVVLNGSWLVCWNQLLEPGDDCPSAWRPIPVPGLWHEPRVGSPFGGRGVATYRLEIALPPSPGDLSLLVGGPLTAHRIWIDGVLRGELGVVGRSAETAVARVFNRVYALGRVSGRTEILVQVANHEFRGGGLRRLWFIGEAASIERGIGRAALRESTLFSVGLVVGLGFLVLFALRPQERARGYFGLMAVLLGLRAVPASITTFGELLAPWTTWAQLVRGEYLGLGLAFLAAVGYVDTKVPQLVPPLVTRGLMFVALAFSAIVVAAPMPIVLDTLPLQWLMPSMLIGVILVCYGRAWRRGAPRVAPTVITAFVYLGFVLHDIVRSAQSDFGVGVELFPYAIVLWILAEAYQLLGDFQRSFEQVETLSDELSEANFELQETEQTLVRWVPFDFLRALGKRSIREVEAGDHVRRRMSVLDCAIRSVAGGGESASDLDFEGLERWVTKLERHVFARNGFVNAFGGEGFQAFFPNGAADAVAAGLDLLAEAEAAAPPGSDAALRIGIDTGEVELGTVGSGGHLVRGVLGEPLEGARRVRDLVASGRARLVVTDATCKDLEAAPGIEALEIEAIPPDRSGGSGPVFAVSRLASR